MIKRGQLTIFIIIAIVVVALVGVVLFFASTRDDVKGGNLPPMNLESVNYYVQECVDDSLATAVEGGQYDDQGLIEAVVVDEVQRCDFSDFDGYYDINVNEVGANVFVNAEDIVASVYLPVAKVEAGQVAEILDFTSRVKKVADFKFDLNSNDVVQQRTVFNLPDETGTITVPEGTRIEGIGSDDTITVEVAQAPEGVNSLGPVYTLGPSVTFSEPVELKIKLTEAALVLADLDDPIVLLRRDGSSDGWEQYPATIDSEGYLVAELTSFSDYLPALDNYKDGIWKTSSSGLSFFVQTYNKHVGGTDGEWSVMIFSPQGKEYFVCNLDNSFKSYMDNDQKDLVVSCPHNNVGMSDVALTLDFNKGGDIGKGAVDFVIRNGTGSTDYLYYEGNLKREFVAPNQNADPTDGLYVTDANEFIYYQTYTTESSIAIVRKGSAIYGFLNPSGMASSGMDLEDIGGQGHKLNGFSVSQSNQASLSYTPFGSSSQSAQGNGDAYGVQYQTCGSGSCSSGQICISGNCYAASGYRQGGEDGLRIEWGPYADVACNAPEGLVGLSCSTGFDEGHCYHFENGQCCSSKSLAGGVVGLDACVNEEVDGSWGNYLNNAFKASAKGLIYSVYASSDQNPGISGCTWNKVSRQKYTLKCPLSTGVTPTQVLNVFIPSAGAPTLPDDFNVMKAPCTSLNTCWIPRSNDGVEDDSGYFCASDNQCYPNKGHFHPGVDMQVNNKYNIGYISWNPYSTQSGKICFGSEYDGTTLKCCTGGYVYLPMGFSNCVIADAADEILEGTKSGITNICKLEHFGCEKTGIFDTVRYWITYYDNPTWHSITPSGDRDSVESAVAAIGCERVSGGSSRNQAVFKCPVATTNPTQVLRAIFPAA